MIEKSKNIKGKINVVKSLIGKVNRSIQYIKPSTQEKHVAPATHLQVVIPDDEYTGLSRVTVEAVTNEIDENIKSENIKEGVSILGVQGSHVGGTDEELETSFRSMIDDTLGMNITKLPNDIKNVSNYAFYYRSNLGKIYLPEGITRIGTSAFSNSGLSKLIIYEKTPPTLGLNAFVNSPITRKTAYIYVPDESVDAYKSATNWSTYASQIRGISYLNPETAKPMVLLHAEDFTDSGINNLEVNYNNITLDDNGKFGKCFYNDVFGVAEPYIDVTLPHELGRVFTIDFWIKVIGYPTADEKYGVPFAIGDYNDGVYFQFETANLALWLGGKNNGISPSEIPMNEWAHFALTYDGTNYKFYINGINKLIFEHSVHTSKLNLNLFRSGGSVTLGRSFKGYIDEFRIVDDVLWEDEFTPPTKIY